MADCTVEVVKAVVEERMRVLQIVKIELGFAALSDFPEDMELSVIRELWDRIERSVNKSV